MLYIICLCANNGMMIGMMDGMMMGYGSFQLTSPNIATDADPKNRKIEKKLSPSRRKILSWGGRPRSVVRNDASSQMLFSRIPSSCRLREAFLDGYNGEYSR